MRHEIKHRIPEQLLRISGAMNLNHHGLLFHRKVIFPYKLDLLILQLQLTCLSCMLRRELKELLIAELEEFIEYFHHLLLLYSDALRTHYLRRVASLWVKYGPLSIKEDVVESIKLALPCNFIQLNLPLGVFKLDCGLSLADNRLDSASIEMGKINSLLLFASKGEIDLLY